MKFNLWFSPVMAIVFTALWYFTSSSNALVPDWLFGILAIVWWVVVIGVYFALYRLNRAKRETLAELK